MSGGLWLGVCVWRTTPTAGGPRGPGAGGLGCCSWVFGESGRLLWATVGCLWLVLGLGGHFGPPWVAFGSSRGCGDHLGVPFGARGDVEGHFGSAWGSWGCMLISGAFVFVNFDNVQHHVFGDGF